MGVSNPTKSPTSLMGSGPNSSSPVSFPAVHCVSADHVTVASGNGLIGSSTTTTPWATAFPSDCDFPVTACLTQNGSVCTQGYLQSCRHCAEGCSFGTTKKFSSFDRKFGHPSISSPWSFNGGITGRVSPFSPAGSIARSTGKCRRQRESPKVACSKYVLIQYLYNSRDLPSVICLDL